MQGKGKKKEEKGGIGLYGRVVVCGSDDYTEILCILHLKER